MSAWDFVCIVLGSWLILAVLIAPRVGRALRRNREAAFCAPLPGPGELVRRPAVPGTPLSRSRTAPATRRPSPPTRITRLPRRSCLAAAVRKTGAVLLLILGLMCLSAVPAKANPVHDAPRYYGPTVTCWTVEQLFPWATDRTCR